MGCAQEKGSRAGKCNRHKSEREGAKDVSTEHQIEDYLYSHPQAIRGLNQVIWIARQFRVPSGIIDLLGLAQSQFTGDWSVGVFEIKKDAIKSQAILQAQRYAADISMALVNAEIYTRVNTFVIGKYPKKKEIFEACSVGTLLMELKSDFSVYPIEMDTKEQDELNAEYFRISRSEIFYKLNKFFSGAQA